MAGNKLWPAIAGIAVLLGFVYSRECPTTDNESILQPGYLYTYKYKSEAFGEAVGTTNDRSRMILECNIKIHHDHECIYNLLLNDCFLNAIGGPPDAETAWIGNRELKDLSRYSVSFTIINGLVADVYSDENDAIFNVNIKRGIISAFVFKLSMTSGEKHQKITDIHGTCPLDSIAVGNGVVTTSKDMMYCAFPKRPDWQFSPWSLFWNMSFIQYQMNSTVNCEYKINLSERQLDSVYCKERHAIGLESTHQTTTAVQTNIHYSMVNMKTEKMKSNKYPLPGHHSGIQFEYEHTPDPTKESEPEGFLLIAQRMLSELVETSTDEIHLSTIPKFTDFVAWLRSSYNILPFIQTVRDCSFLDNNGISCDKSVKELSMSYLSDALVQCQTVPCFEAVSNLAVNDDLSTIYLSFVLFSWTNMHYTKAEIIPHITAICEKRNSKFCWLSLGTIVKQYRGSSKRVDAIKTVAELFSNKIGRTCVPPQSFDSETKRNEHMLTYLKTIGNMGELFLSYEPQSVFELLKCVEKPDLPVYVRVTALEALSQLNVCSDKSLSLCFPMTTFVTSLLKNESENVDLRLAAYQLLMITPELFSFEKDLVALFKQERNTQILSYVSSDLISRMKDREYLRNNPNFVRTLAEDLEKEDIQLELFVKNEDSSSFSKLIGRFMDLSFLPKHLQGFGAKLSSSDIYSVYTQMPEHIRKSITLKLFNKVINLFSVDGKFSDWQNIAVNLLEESGWKFLIHLLNLIDDKFKHRDVKSDPRFLNGTIDENIYKLYSMYKNTKHSEFPFYDISLQALGNTLQYITLEDFMELRRWLGEYLVQRQVDWSYGINDDFTRVFRVIEAYNQVPTLMGLSLNWTTNATFAIGIRRKLDGFMVLDKDSWGNHVNEDFKHSAALTFLNRMVLDFPTITQIGIQANSSAYTSTQLRQEFIVFDTKREIIYAAPKKPQKLLELFRTNQIIKHDHYEDIPDWDIERTTSSWCLDDSYSSVLGFQICHERSYPNVTHLIKPWALMAGSCKWSLELRPYDRTIKSYNLAMVSNPTSRELQLKFNTPGGDHKREINMDMSFFPQGHKFEMTIPALPDFYAFVTRNSIFEDDKPIGFLDLVQFKPNEQSEYLLTVDQREQIEVRSEGSSDKNSSPKTKKKSVQIQEKKITFSTPFNKYTFTQNVDSQSGNTKADINLIYENQQPGGNYLQNILPSTFWESPTKASLHLQAKSRMHKDTLKGAGTFDVVGEVITPGTEFALILNQLSASNHDQFTVNVTATPTSTRQLSSFGNFTYDAWKYGIDENNFERIQTFNLTLPQQSWGILEKSSLKNGKYLQNTVYTQAKMIRLNKLDHEPYIGWWSDDVKHLFKLEQTELKYVINIENSYIDDGEVYELFSNIPQSEIKHSLNQFVDADISFYYPVNGKEEAVKFNGRLLISYLPTAFRFQKDFVLLSTYNNMQLNSHSIYKSGSNEVFNNLFHNSYLTHTKSGIQAFYNMEFKHMVNENQCPQVEFNHNITSHVFNMMSNVTYMCNSNNAQQHMLTLNWDSNSSYWNMLDMTIRQYIVDLTPVISKEKMTFMSPSMRIEVFASWIQDDHTKNATFIHLPDNTPVMRIMRHVAGDANKFEVIFPQGHTENKLIYSRKFYDGFKKMKAELYYPDRHNKVSCLHGVILRPDSRLWKLELYHGINNLANSIGAVMGKMSHAVTTLSNDPKHPINTILKPALKMPLAQYIKELQEEIKSTAQNVATNLGEAVYSLHPMYDLPLEISRNLTDVLLQKVKDLYSVVEKKSIAIWTVKYFELPQFLQEKIRNIPPFSSLLKSYLLQQNLNVLKELPMRTFVYRSGDLVDWESFNNYPILAGHRINKKYSIYQDSVIGDHHEQKRNSKIAAIFGTQHVYTFDGLMYRVPDYPSKDCSYLLAVDLKAGIFSAYATSEFLVIKFIYSHFKINEKDEIFLNSNEKPLSLPFEIPSQKISITREGSMILLKSPSLTVVCEGQNFLCIFELTSWNGGGTIGLLGNADGELHNEYMLPDGRIADNIIDLLHTYELTGKSKCRNLHLSPNNSAAAIERASRSVKGTCSKRADQVCPFYHHLKKRFWEQCVVYSPDDKDVCYTEVALSALCYYKQQEMKTDCNVVLREGTNIRYRLKIVLIVNQQISKQKDSVLKKGLGLTMDALQQTFENAGYSTILYSLIGFGGEGVRYNPSVYAIGGNVWVTHKDSMQLLQNLKFTATSRRQKVDPIQATKYAAEVLGYDNFDTKVFVMYSAVDHQIAEKDVLHKVQMYLDKNHITLYTISSYPSIEKGRKVYGVRADGLVFPKAKSGEDFVDYPKGDMAKLTAGTRGSVFLEKFFDYRDSSHFFNEFADEVQSKVDKEHRFCRECVSVRSGWWNYQNECSLSNCPADY